MNKDTGFADAEAKRILERAAAIDAEDQRRLDANALREIATQAGISLAAVDKALAEHVGDRRSVGARILRPGWLITVIVVGALIVLRMLTPA